MKEKDTLITSANRKKKNLISVIIWDVITVFILMATGFYYKRLVVFSKMFTSISAFFQIAGLIVYVFSLVFLFVGFGYLTIYMLSCHYKGKDWNPIVDKVLVKTDIFSFIFKVISLLLFILIFIINPCRVNGSSMYPTLKNGDYLISSGMFYQPKRNDVVIFDATNYTADESFYIKRVVAQGGDTISYDYDNNQLLVNNEAVKDYVSGNKQEISYQEYKAIFYRTKDYKANGEKVSYKLEYDELVVFGDNRGASLDSRRFGVVNKADVFGRIIIYIGGGQ